MKLIVLSVVALFALCGTAHMGAHHSYAGFSDTAMSLEGTLERVLFANPHVVLTIRTKDSSLYTAVWVAAFTLENRGMKATDLKKGDVIVITGTPALDPSVHEITRLSEVRRLSDGWRWFQNNGDRGPAILSSR
jgi:hypothetical protein